MHDPKARTVTCKFCDHVFPVEELIPLDPNEESNTQVHWLVVGHCPNCDLKIEVSLEEMRKMAGRVARGEDEDG